MKTQAWTLLWSVASFIFKWPYRLLQTIIHQLLALVLTSKKGMLPPIHNCILLDPAISLAENIRKQKVTSETVLIAYLERIREVNPHLNALVEDRFVEALKEAVAADNYILTSGKSLEELAVEKPFLGVPFTVKDAIAVKGLALTAGVVARKGIKAVNDCAVVARLRLAGAIPLCVTNVPELCTWWDASNKLYGSTNNPHDLTRIPGGSSGGEGALISAAGSIMGLGNDINGGIRNPSFFCGIFGHKPTKGIVSNEGQFPTSHGNKLEEYNSTGPMCRYAVDLLPLLQVIAGDKVSKLHLNIKVALKDVKVFYTEEYIDHPMISAVDSKQKLAVRKIVKHLQAAYGLTAKKVSIPHLSSAWSISLTKIEADQGPTPRSDLTVKNPTDFELFHELRKSVLGKSDHTFHFLHLEFLHWLHNTSLYNDANKRNQKIAQEMSSTFEDILGNDGVFIFPSGPETAPYHLEQNFEVFNHAYLGLFNILGLPVTQCPVGLSSEKLPLGVQVVANLNNDRLTLAVAKEIEEAFGGWKSPSRVLLL